MENDVMLELIQKKVVMLNNKKCQTLNEALNKESGEHGCLISFESNNKYISYIGTVFSESHFNHCRYVPVSGGLNSFYKIELTHAKTHKIKSQKILGLPITISRLLIALNSTIKTENNNAYFIDNNIIGLRSRNKLKWFKKTHIYNIEKICDYAINKSFYDQNDKTIKTIYTLLNKHEL